MISARFFNRPAAVSRWSKGTKDRFNQKVDVYSDPVTIIPGVHVKPLTGREVNTGMDVQIGQYRITAPGTLVVNGRDRIILLDRDRLQTLEVKGPPGESVAGGVAEKSTFIATAMDAVSA